MSANIPNNVILTIFTPAYNRAHTLPRTYESLCNQSNKGFIWLIVDDGSTDNTHELIKGWQAVDNGFEIQYIYKKNGGMHTAHNTAYEHIRTELNVYIDSDDCLSIDAVEKILRKWEKVKEDGYAGIVGLDVNMQTGEIIGKGFRDGEYKTTLSGYYAKGGSGDKKLVYRTDIINKYPPYPTFPDEKYFSLSYKYLLIDQKYELAILNEPLCCVEYQADGSSNNMFRQYLRNPKGFAYWRTIRMKYDTSMKRKVVDCIHYCSSSQIAANEHYISQSPNKFLTFICAPFGWALTAYIKKKAE